MWHLSESLFALTANPFLDESRIIYTKCFDMKDVSSRFALIVQPSNQFSLLVETICWSAHRSVQRIFNIAIKVYPGIYPLTQSSHWRNMNLILRGITFCRTRFSAPLWALLVMIDK